jgi:hypothetical protein
MTAETLTLTDFLLARIAEDEATARAYRDGAWSGNPYAGDGDGSDFRYDERFDPARVLAQCAAHRAIVEAHPITTEVVGYGHRTHDFGCVTCHDWDGVTSGLGYCPTLRALASVYADHADYRPEWA